MEESPLALQVRAGPTGKLYGAVTSALVAEELSRQLDVEVDRRNVVLDEGIQELGSFEVTVKLHSQITATVALLVEQIQE
jgi:large subunit ribosomal protein L9